MDLFKLREEFSRKGIMMCFNGPFSHSIIEEIGIAIKNYLAAEKSSKMAVQDVFSTYVEMTQNARNYLSVKGISSGDAGAATIVIAKQEERYVITAGNTIHKDDVGELQARIDRINALEGDELKKVIRLQLRTERAPDALGAGIGLMEIARRASSRLRYSFHEIDQDYAFFTLTVSI
jgi:hypothetical protein